VRFDVLTFDCVISQFISEDGKKVRRINPITESAIEELQVLNSFLLFLYFCILDNADKYYYIQSRIIVAENLPEDHCYQNLMKIFSTVGRYTTI